MGPVNRIELNVCGMLKMYIRAFLVLLHVYIGIKQMHGLNIHTLFGYIK